MGIYCEVSAASPDHLSEPLDTTGLLAGLVRSASVTADGVSLEKAWHGLHFLLTGDVEEGDGPLAFLLVGGEHLEGDEEAPRWFRPEETANIHQALSRVTNDALWSRFDAEQMTELAVYPGIWDEDEADLREEYLGYFHELKRVVAAAAQSGRGLLVTIG